MTDWKENLGQARKGLALLTESIEQLQTLRDAASAEIAKYLRADAGVDLDADAIAATLSRPYTLIPVSENEATLIHWRGIKMPLFGWVVKQEPAFTIARVSRGMGLLTPFPDWMKDELGWQPPEHGAVIDGSRTSVRITKGDEGTFKRRYGPFLKQKQADGTYRIRPGGAWVKLVAALVRDGILPYTPQPVAAGDWVEDSESNVRLRDYQAPFIEQFREKGAVFFNLPPGAGKTMLSLYILSHLKGKAVIFAPSVILCEQWQARVKEYAPTADVTILTYASGKKALEREWALAIFDEVQTLPADTFSKLAFLKAKYRIGLSASPWREDGRQYMITALSGFPCSIRWADLIRAGVLKRPRIVIATVANDAAKVQYAKSLLTHRRPGRALIFCDYLEQGQQLANALDLPFVSGETPHKLARVQEAEACVVSRIADRGLDFADLTLVIEVAFMGKSREQEAQRLGRLLHAQGRGEHYLLFTPDEAERFRPRIFGIESELAGEVDLEFIAVGNVPKAERTTGFEYRPRRTPKPQAVAVKEGDEAGAALASPAIRRLILDHEKNLGATRQGYMVRAFRILWKSDGTGEELRLREGKAEKAWEPYRAGLNALVRAGLAKKVSERYYLDRARVNALRG